MGFATFSLVLCLTAPPRREACTPPIPSAEVFQVDPLSITPNGRHAAYQACVSRAEALVAEADKALEGAGLEAYIYKPREACKPQGFESPDPRGSSTHSWGYGA